MTGFTELTYERNTNLRYPRNCIPYSGYNLQDAIFVNHQISYLAVIFANIKFANHCMYRVTFCVARSFYMPATITIAIGYYRIPHLQVGVVKYSMGEVLVCRHDT